MAVETGCVSGVMKSLRILLLYIWYNLSPLLIHTTLNSNTAGRRDASIQRLSEQQYSPAPESAVNHSDELGATTITIWHHASICPKWRANRRWLPKEFILWIQTTGRRSTIWDTRNLMELGFEKSDPQSPADLVDLFPDSARTLSSINFRSWNVCRIS